MPAADTIMLSLKAKSGIRSRCSGRLRSPTGLAVVSYAPEEDGEEEEGKPLPRKHTGKLLGCWPPDPGNSLQVCRSAR